MTITEIEHKACKLVYLYLTRQKEGHIVNYEDLRATFCSIKPQSWKVDIVLMGSDNTFPQIFEVEHDDVKKMTFVDVYQMTRTFSVLDSEEKEEATSGGE